MGDAPLELRALTKWCAGTSIPETVQSFEFLRCVEQRYCLPKDYFRSKLPHTPRATRGHVLEAFSAAERRRLVWHLPGDFAKRPVAEQEEILDWVQRVIVSGATDYRRFQAAAMKQRYAVRFRKFQGTTRKGQTSLDVVETEKEADGRDGTGVKDGVSREAPAECVEE